MPGETKEIFRKDHQLFRTTGHLLSTSFQPAMCDSTSTQLDPDLLQFPGDQVLELLDLCVQSIGLKTNCESLYKLESSVHTNSPGCHHMSTIHIT